MFSLDLSASESPLKKERRVQTFFDRYIKNLNHVRSERGEAFRRTGELQLEIVHPNKKETIVVRGTTTVVVSSATMSASDALAASRTAYDVVRGAFEFALAVLRQERATAEGKAVDTRDLPRVSAAQLALAERIAPRPGVTRRKTMHHPVLTA